MKVVIFEDACYNNYYPISATRPLWDLRCGGFTFSDRLELILKKKYSGEARISYYCRNDIAELLKTDDSGKKINEPLYSDEPILFLNSLLTDIAFLNLNEFALYGNNGRLLAAYIVPKETVTTVEAIHQMMDFEMKSDASFCEVKCDYNYLWDIVLKNGQQIVSDFQIFDKDNNLQSKYNYACIGDSTEIFIEDDVTIDPYVVIDVRKGPVIIRNGTVINSFTRIEGPCYIGENCILLGAKVREGCSLGRCCRVGGEIEDSIFQSYSNKYHDGFIGHAYIGEWVNLGAMTTNSDLKNDYSSVKVYIPDRIHDSNETKVGCFIGDFTKTSIGTLINTGCSLGVGCMTVQSGRMTPPHLPDFCWFIKNEIREIPDINAFIESIRKMMSRRNVQFSQELEGFLLNLFTKKNNIRKLKIAEWKEKQN